MTKEYLKRTVDIVLTKALATTGAVLIEGPKWCGKTRTSQEKAKSALFMQDPDYSANYLRIADTKPSLLLEGETPRLIDEWQTAPVLWDAVRFAVDQRSEKGQFILTGSAVPNDNTMQHTGTGRISRILMRPMSLFESLDSNGTISLEKMFEKEEDIAGKSDLTLEKLAYVITRGGWPDSINESDIVALGIIHSYIEAIINADMTRVDGMKKNPLLVRTLMRSLARNVASTANLSTLRNDMLGSGENISERTLSTYLNALRRIYVIEDLPAWNPALRSKTAQRSSPKRHFVDPSIATAVLRASKDSLLHDFNTFGLLFESLCIRDLRVYSQLIDGEIFHYRDKNDLEADAIVSLRDGRWAAVEVKMGAKEIELAAANLKKLESKIDLNRMQIPSFLMILTAEGLAYRRADGVYVVPIGCLKY